ncbi:CRISPR-associated endonuclease Cas1 [Oceanicella actignis]|uniref:CRISPR-associated endonuclease Cas1 n=1 Tax=Oceanicella actignis TaxID=1189325 RepID=A0A1M7S1J2_9RHOB|nr:CRISPR-associated endonuclease Cas1 [Oceanicella actignis]SES91149.1 CRISP-associated protein Cas1 [Oceanicella actignis]SHN52467.1 CRISP-associated protein Cas1 [Oceanicella actignis]
MRGLSRLIVHGSATIEAGALNLLWQAGVGVLFLSGRNGEAGARFHGAAHGDAGIRLAQYRLWHDPVRRHAWARDLVRLRLRMMRRTARRIALHRRAGRRILSPALAAIDRAESSIDQAQGIASLRGIEGAAAAAWFSAYAQLFPPSLGFSARRRRPPPDPVNALLSLGYTIAAAEAAGAANRAGLDPAIGLIHGLAHGREALALDIVEPARPLVDDFVHDLFHSRTIEARHFSREEGRAAVLGKAGRQAFYHAWEERAAPNVRTVVAMVAREGVRRLRREMRAQGGEGPEDDALS